MADALKQAAQQALEALRLNSDREFNSDHPALYAAIAALEAALSHPEHEPEAAQVPQGGEPFGWLYESVSGIRVFHKAGETTKRMDADRETAAKYPGAHTFTTLYTRPATDAPQAVEAPSVEAAREMGAKGAPAVEAERLAFEAWMAGHCWELCAYWDMPSGQYLNNEETTGYVNMQAIVTRRLWAAWRDRAALASQPMSREGVSGPETVALIEECRDAFAEELAAVDLDPPLHHVKQGYDKCAAWLVAHGIGSGSGEGNAS